MPLIDASIGITVPMPSNDAVTVPKNTAAVRQLTAFADAATEKPRSMYTSTATKPSSVVMSARMLTGARARTLRTSAHAITTGSGSSVSAAGGHEAGSRLPSVFDMKIM